MSSLAVQVADLSPEERQEFWDGLTPAQREALLYDWAFWARPEQILPPGDWFCWLLMAGRGFGKALALGTPIPTPSGWTTMGDLADGDEVFDELGQVCRVQAAHPVQHGRRCRLVRFDDGSEIVCDADHLWLTWDKAARKSYGRAENPTQHPEVRTTDEIARTLMHLGRERNHSIAVTQPLKLPEADLPIDPYVLGFWLGDGSSASAAVTIGDKDAEHILTMLATCGAPVTGPVQRRLGNVGTYPIGGKSSVRDPVSGRMLPNGSLHSSLRGLGVLGNKHIPMSYLRASIDQRWALLRGLMDADGYAKPNGNAAELCLTNRRLAADATDLMLSLGLRVVCKESRATLNGRDVAPRWRMTLSSREPLFTLPRKLSNRRPDAAQRTRTTHRRIVAVEEVGSVPVRCITVDSPSSLYLCGRSLIPTHNTATGAQAIRTWHRNSPRLALVGETSADVRDVMVEGPAGILASSPPDERPVYEPSKRRLTWPNGATATCFAGVDPDQLRGPQHDKAWVDEIAKVKYPQETWDNLTLGMRLGTNPQIVCTTTPRPIPLIRALVAAKTTHLTRGSTYDNLDNLAPTFREQVLMRYEGTTLGRQELYGEIIEDVEGALWKRSTIEANRTHSPPPLRRLVVGVDPPGSASGAECGIVAAGVDDSQPPHFFVLDDRSLQGLPTVWGGEAVALYHTRSADRLVAERNFGGDMVESTIRQVDADVAFRAVTASRGKRVRAEPVAALAEQGRLHHVGTFGPLEDECCSWTGEAGQPSPNRLDAMVWAVTDLMEHGGGPASIAKPRTRIRDGGW